MSALASARVGRNTIGDAVGRACAVFRDRVALRFAGRAWTFHQVDAITDQVAHNLRAGLQRGDRAVAFGRNSDDYLFCWIGCCKAGVIHVPANYALSAPELGYIIKQCGARMVFHGDGMTVTAEAAGDATVRPLTTLMEGAPETPFEDDSVGDVDVAQILYTSGTTGAPKGAMLTHRALLSEYMSCIIACEFSARDRALAALPLYHSAQMHVFVMPQLLCGAETLLIEAPEPALCLRLIAQHRLDSFFAPPTVWINLLRHPDFDKHDLSCLRRAYYGAAIMPVPVLQELRTRLPGMEAFNCYGQSEVAPLATVLKPHEHDARPASVGRPALNVRTRVVDPDMNDVPPGVQGEIVHRTPHVMLGYWAKPEETARAFEGGWFHSGDVGVMDEEGYLFVVDRIKDVINTGGVLVASREVEEALFTHPAVSEVAAIAVPDPQWIEAIAAIVVLKRDCEATEAELVAHARTCLAPFKLPKRVFFAEDLPRNSAGKLLKRELRQQYSGTTSAVMGIDQAEIAGSATKTGGKCT